MPDAAAFDALAAAETMAEAGIEEPHAKAIAATVRDGRAGLATGSDIRRLEDSMATKSDVAELKVAIAGLEARFHRALWIQGGAIIAILAAIRARTGMIFAFMFLPFFG